MSLVKVEGRLLCVLGEGRRILIVSQSIGKMKVSICLQPHNTKVISLSLVCLPACNPSLSSCRGVKE